MHVLTRFLTLPTPPNKQAVKFESDQIHRIQKCTTREDFLKELEILKRACPPAVEYLNKHCDPKKTFLYRILQEGYTTHGHKTSNIVEIMNSVIGEARFRDPYYLNDFMLKWHGGKLAERQHIGNQLKVHNKLLTTYASTMLGKREPIAREAPLEIKA